MKIYYDNNTGKIYYAVKDKDVFWFSHTTNIPLTELDIEEIDDNKDQCHDVMKNYKKLDEKGEGKFTIEEGVVVTNNSFEEYNFDTI